MTDRNTGKILTDNIDSSDELIYVYVNYPKATSLSLVLGDVAKWSDMNFVMDPQLNHQIQIFSPRKLSKEDAFKVFMASLESIGLRVVTKGNVAKVVPVGLGKIAV